MRTTVILDDELVREAFRLAGARTKRELLSTALRELVRSRRKTDLLDLAGRIRFHEGFDHKKLRGTRG